MPLSDHEIESRDIVTPLVRKKTKLLPGSETPCLSYGLGHHGVDIRLGDEVLAFCPGRLDMLRQWLGQALEFIGLESLGQWVMPPAIDPKAMDHRYLKRLKIHEDASGRYVILPARAAWLGVAVEHIDVPLDVLVDCIGKSTYARIGGLIFSTPAEPGWSGYLTLEGANMLSVRSLLYIGEGVVQLVFHDGEATSQGYEGKYEGQGPSVTLAKV
jgi:deoxycytidine triphosphate deaminase